MIIFTDLSGERVAFPASRLAHIYEDGDRVRVTLTETDKATAMFFAPRAALDSIVAQWTAWMNRP